VLGIPKRSRDATRFLDNITELPNSAATGHQDNAKGNPVMQPGIWLMPQDISKMLVGMLMSLGI